MRIKHFVFSTLVALLSLQASAGDEFDSTFRCYRGDHVLLGLTRSSEYASTIIVMTQNLRVGNDAFCSSNLRGGCSIDGAGGHFEILEADDSKLEVDFYGQPKIFTDETGSVAWIVPFKGHPERLMHMELKRAENSECKY